MSKSEATMDSKISMVRDLIFGEEMNSINKEIDGIHKEIFSLKQSMESSFSELKEMMGALNTNQVQNQAAIEKKLSDSRGEFSRLLAAVEEKSLQANQQINEASAKREHLASLFEDIANRLRGNGEIPESVNSNFDSVENE